MTKFYELKSGSSGHLCQGCVDALTKMGRSPVKRVSDQQGTGIAPCQCCDLSPDRPGIPGVVERHWARKAIAAQGKPDCYALWA